MEVKNSLHIRHDGKAGERRRFLWLGTYIIVALVCIAAYFLLHTHVFVLPETYHNKVEKACMAGFLGTLILCFSKFVQIVISNKGHSKYKKYNLIRLTHLVSLILVALLVTSFLFSNLYAAAVSLGLISLILGFALQTPISSFIGWIYIITRNPYGIGDRIQINDIKGDVMEIGYLDTTIWEFAGDYLTNDLPSGRLMRFPNSLVLQSPVFNYSWRDFRYIWNEIPFHVAYESDLAFVKKTISDVTKAELGDDITTRIEQLKKLVKESPIEEIEIKEYPYVSLRINPNTWVEVTVTYLVSPKQAASTRTRIIEKVIAALQQQPDKTMFPKTNSR